MYTLYHRASGEPFVHALNANARTAFCIDLPWRGSTEVVWNAKLALSGDEKQLTVRSADGRALATIDTETLELR